MKNIKIEEREEYFYINGRYAIYKTDGAIYDTLAARDIPKEVFDIRESLKKEYPKWI